MTAESQLTTTNAVIMKEKLFINTKSSPAPCEGNYKFNCNHSHVKLCQVMLAYRLLMQQQYDWVQKLPTENKELLSKKRKMSAWRDWAFFEGNIPQNGNSSKSNMQDHTFFNYEFRLLI